MNIQTRKLLTYLSLIFISSCFVGCGGQEYRTSQKPVARSISSESPKVPYGAKYKEKNKELVFLAVGHEIPARREGFDLAKMIMVDFRPKAVIVEGLIDQPTSRQAYYDYINKCASSEFRYCGEAAYVAHLAKSQHAAIFGGEPTDQMLWKVLKNKGVSVQDFIGMSLLWKIPQWNREQKAPEDFEKYAESQIRSYLYLTTSHVRFTYRDFREWYKMHTGKPLIIPSIKSDVFFESGSTLLKKVAHEINQVREEFLSKQIAQTLKRYSKVVVAYGENHYRAQQSVLEDLFGSPIQYITWDASVTVEDEDNE